MDTDKTQTLRVVCHWDPALDMTLDEREAYARERYDVSKLRIIPGRRPTVYHVKPLTRAQMRVVNEVAYDHERTLRAFSYAVAHVTDLVVTVDGEDRVVPKTVPTGGSPEHRYWSTENLEAVSEWAVREVGGVAYAHSDFPPGIERVYPLLRSSQLVSVAVDRLHAAKIQRDAAQSNALLKAQREGEVEAQKQPAQSGDAPTGATATA